PLRVSPGRLSATFVWYAPAHRTAGAVAPFRQRLIGDFAACRRRVASLALLLVIAATRRARFPTPAARFPRRSPPVGASLRPSNPQRRGRPARLPPLLKVRAAIRLCHWE